MATSEPGLLQTEYGLSPAQVVRLQDPSLMPAVLAVVSRDYDLLAEAVLAWLLDLTHGRDPAVSARVAVALGELSLHDFAHVRQRVLLPRATAGDHHGRVLVADALGVAVWDPDVSPLVLGLLKNWARSGNNPALQRTAALAYGGGVGLRHTVLALDELYRLALNIDDVFLPDVTTALEDLVLAAAVVDPQRAAVVLEVLAGWLLGPERAVLTSLAVAMRAFHVVTGVRGARSRALWEVLTGPAGLPTAATLLGRALSHRVAQGHALDVVRALLRLADADETVLNALGGLLVTWLADSSARPNDRERLQFHLRQWARGPDASTSAPVLLRTIEEVGP